MSGRDGRDGRDGPGDGEEEGPTTFTDRQIAELRKVRADGYVSLAEALAYVAWTEGQQLPKIPLDSLPRPPSYSPREGPLEAHVLGVAPGVPTTVLSLLRRLAQEEAYAIVVTPAGNRRPVDPHSWVAGSPGEHAAMWNADREFASDPPHIYLTAALRFAAYIPERQADEDRIDDALKVYGMDDALMVRWSLTHRSDDAPRTSRKRHGVATADAPPSPPDEGTLNELLGRQGFNSEELRRLLVDAMWEVLVAEEPTKPIPWKAIARAFEGRGGHATSDEKSEYSFSLREPPDDDVARTSQARNTWRKLVGFHERTSCDDPEH